MGTHGTIYKYNTTLITQDSEFKWYFAGFVAADGNIYVGGNDQPTGTQRRCKVNGPVNQKVEITLNQKDIDLLAKFRDIIVPDKPIYLRPETNAARLTLTSRSIVNEFIRLGIKPRKSLTLEFPNMPNQYIHHFIRGYIDGDGTWGTKKASRVLADGTKHEYYGLRCKILGTQSFLNDLSLKFDGRKRTPYKRGNFYSIELNFSAAQRLAEWLYNDATIYLERKRSVITAINTLDSAQLATNYGTLSGHYNTLADPMHLVA